MKLEKLQKKFKKIIGSGGIRTHAISDECVQINIHKLSFSE